MPTPGKPLKRPVGPTTGLITVPRAARHAKAQNGHTSGHEFLHVGTSSHCAIRYRCKRTATKQSANATPFHSPAIVLDG